MSDRLERKVSQMAEDIVQQIIDTMALKGVSTSGLSTAANVSRAYTSRVLNGHNVPTIDWLARVVDALGLEIKLAPKAKPVKRRKAG